MANNLRKFNTLADYQAAVLVKPAVSLIASDDSVYFDQKDATFSGLTVHYNITDISQPTELFKGSGGGSGSGSGSGSGGVLPSAMIIDGTEIEPTNTYQFSTTGEHIVQYSFEENTIPEEFLYNFDESKLFNSVVQLEVGDAITSIGNRAFTYCHSLTSCTIGSGVTSIGDEALAHCNSLPSITIPDSVTSIGQTAFASCTSLTSIDIPSGVTSIGEYAFYVCSGLTTCTIGSGVTSISVCVFNSCSSLTSITIPDSVTSIGDAAFSDCSSLTSIDIPSGVASIGASVFSSCSGLTSIVCNATTAPTINDYTFIYIKTGGTLTVPIGSTGYDVWMGTGNYYLGKYGWTKVEQ